MVKDDANNEFYSKASLMISMIAILVSVVSVGYTIYLNEQSKIEDLSVFTSRYNANYKAEIIHNNNSVLPAILPTWYKCTLINKGYKPLVIVGYDLIQVPRDIKIFQNYSDAFYSSVSYSDMRLGLYDEAGKIVDFPMDMPPQSSSKFHLEVGLVLNEKAFEIIHNNSSLKNETTIREIDRLLAKNGMDIYGNSATYIQSNDSSGSYDFSVSPNRLEQTFIITFKTSNNKLFSDKFSWYKLEAL
jgi:hypothetical protein